MNPSSDIGRLTDKNQYSQVTILPDAFLTQYRLLFKISGYAAILIAAFIPLQIILYFIWPPPSDVAGWYALFQQHPIIGLMDMDLLLMVDYVLLLLVFLSFFLLLNKENKSLTTIGFILQLLATVIYFSSAVAFEMLSLSHDYAKASSLMEKMTLLGAGKGMLVTWQGSAFNISYILSCIALLMISVVMLKSVSFSRKIAWLGIVMGLLMVIPPTAGKAGLILSMLSLIPTIPWLIFVGIQLFQFSKVGNLSHEKERVSYNVML